MSEPGDFQTRGIQLDGAAAAQHGIACGIATADEQLATLSTVVPVAMPLYKSMTPPLKTVSLVSVWWRRRR